VWKDERGGDEEGSFRVHGAMVPPSGRSRQAPPSLDPRRASEASDRSGGLADAGGEGQGAAVMADRPMTLEEGIRTRLEEALGPVLFTDLRAHLARDAVFVVGPTVSLVECGVRVALDDVTAVTAWIASGELRKPSSDERAAWPAAAGRRWMALVVQPFVLVQDLAD
jgi:hypothetical protein